VGEQNLARFGQEDPLANPLEQQRTADLLELLDLQRDRRMRQMQLLRCPGKGEVARGDRENLELAYGSVSH